MTERHEALDRLRSINPVPVVDLLDPDDISTLAALCEERRLTPNAGPPLDPLLASRRSRTRPALVFAAAFAAVIAGAGIFALLGRGGQPVIDEPPAPAAAPIVTTTTAPAPTTIDPTIAAATLPPVVWIHDTVVGDDGSLWVGTTAGLVRWLPGADSPIIYTTADGLLSDDVQNAVVAPDGTVWVGGHGWMASFDDLAQQRWTVYSAEDSDGPMAIGPDGTVWSVAGLDRLLRFDGLEWEMITVPELPGNDIPWSRSVAVAPDGTVWAGANDHRGVVSYDGTDFAYYEMWDGQPDQSAATVAVAPNGTVWVGGDIAGDDPGTGVASFDGTAWTQYTTEDGLVSDAARVAIGPDGTVWAVHYGPEDSEAAGVSRFDGSAWTGFPDVPAPGFPAAVDTSGTLWVPSAEGDEIISFDGISTTVLDLPALEPATAGPFPNPPDPTPATRRPIPTTGDWNPILIERHAGPAPPAATCSSGTNPDGSGPTGQDGPKPDEYSNQAADFDRVWGRVVYIDSRRKTWTFDVCTNTWHAMAANGALPGGGSLVYDVDSDRTVLLGNGLIWVYDRDVDTWEWRSAPQSESHGWSSLSAFYDPLSGLIVSIQGEELGDTHATAFSAYDVDTDEWTTVGSTNTSTYTATVGYSHEADRIVTAGVFSEYGIVLIDPRTGAVEMVEQTHPEFVGGFGSSELANGAATAFAVALGPDGFGNTVCGFDAETSGWQCTPGAPRRDYGVRPYDAITYDWINERLVFIGGAIHPWGDGEITYFDDVWSLDPVTGEWLELVSRSAGDS